MFGFRTLSFGVWDYHVAVKGQVMVQKKQNAPPSSLLPGKHRRVWMICKYINLNDNKNCHDLVGETFLSHAFVTVYSLHHNTKRSTWIYKSSHQQEQKLQLHSHNPQRLRLHRRPKSHLMRQQRYEKIDFEMDAGGDTNWRDMKITKNLHKALPSSCCFSLSGNVPFTNKQKVPPWMFHVSLQ